MIVTVWRHGEAERGSPDRDRRLTARGTEDIARAGPIFMSALETRGLPRPSSLLCSRWRRTSETATGLTLSLGLPPVEDDALIPDACINDVEARLGALGLETHIVLVSHQPLVSQLIDQWLGESGRVPPLSPGAFAVLSASVWARGCAEIVFWGAPPEYAV